jgi:hypothetical protein
MSVCVGTQTHWIPYYGVSKKTISAQSARIVHVCIHNHAHAHIRVYAACQKIYDQQIRNIHTCTYIHTSKHVMQGVKKAMADKSARFATRHGIGAYIHTNLHTYIHTYMQDLLPHMEQAGSNMCVCGMRECACACTTCACACMSSYLLRQEIRASDVYICVVCM